MKSRFSAGFFNEDCGRACLVDGIRSLLAIVRWFYRFWSEMRLGKSELELEKRDRNRQELNLNEFHDILEFSIGLFG